MHVKTIFQHLCEDAALIRTIKLCIFVWACGICWKNQSIEKKRARFSFKIAVNLMINREKVRRINKTLISFEIAISSKFNVVFAANSAKYSFFYIFSQLKLNLSCLMSFQLINQQTHMYFCYKPMKYK